jgi:hypothetical protein
LLAPFIEGMIKHDHGGQIPAFLLRSSHTGRKFIPKRRHLRRLNFSGVRAIKMDF